MKDLATYQQGSFQNKSTTEIENEIKKKKLYSAINAAKRKHVPIIHYRELPHLQFIPTIRNLIAILNTIRTQLQQNFTPENRSL